MEDREFNLTGVIAFLAFIMLIYICCMPIIEEVSPTKVSSTTDTFSEKLLIQELKNLEVHHVDIVLAQARLETGNFKSKMFLENRNLFGWRPNGKYKKYTCWRRSVFDYKLFQYKYYKQGEDYFSFLTRVRYAEADSIYKKRILTCIK